MVTFWTGKPAADALMAANRARADALRSKGIAPLLALLRVGDDPAAAHYEASICRSAESAAVMIRKETLPEQADGDAVLRVIRMLNADDAVHGILLFLPLPRHLRREEKLICAAIAPEKDVDGVSPLSAAGAFLGEPVGFTPCAAEACMKMLDHYGYDCTGKRAVVVGRSRIIGKPAAMLLLGRNATVTICHTKTADLAAETRRADLVLAASGSVGLLGRDHLRPGAVVLDVGAGHDAQTGKLAGDVQQAAVETLAAYTPVPGGVGVITGAVLMEHIVRAAEAR